MKLSRRRVTWMCVCQSDVSFIKIPETCVCNSDLFSASPFSSARLKGNFGPFLPFYYLFFLFLCRSGRKESLKISTREKFVCWNSDCQNPFVRWSFTYRHRFFKEEDMEIFVLFPLFFLYASCKRRFISIDWFKISAKEVHPHSLLYGSSWPSANATNCCKQPSST